MGSRIRGDCDYFACRYSLRLEVNRFVDPLEVWINLSLHVSP